MARKESAQTLKGTAHQRLPEVNDVLHELIRLRVAIVLAVQVHCARKTAATVSDSSQKRAYASC